MRLCNFHYLYLQMGSYTPEERTPFQAWQQLPLGEERDKAKKDAYYKLAVSNPGVVAWYCALRLEMTVHLACATLSRQLQSAEVAGKELAKAALQQEIQQAMGETDVIDVIDIDIPSNWGEVDDYWATIEWSSGGTEDGILEEALALTAPLSLV